MRTDEGSERRQDLDDLGNAQKPTAEDEQKKPWFKCIGPGLVTGAADDDPSGVGTYSANGAQFGYFLLWLVPFTVPLMIAVQEMCGRVAAVTGKGLAAIIKAHYPRWILYSCVACLLAANVFNVFADLNVMAASMQMLFGLPLWAGLTLFTALLVTTQIFVPYRLYAKLLKWLCLSLLGYVAVAVMPAIKTNWGEIAKNLVVPHLNFESKTVLAVVAFLGTTISPYLFFWQAGETVEEEIAECKADEPGNRIKPVKEQEIRNIRADTVIGMVASQLVALSIIVAASGTLHASGKTEINTAQDAAKALQPLGPIAYGLFSICIVGTGLLAIPTLAGSAAYSVAETFGWPYGLYRRFSRARGFYLTIAAVIVLGFAMNCVRTISPIKALVYSAALNGVIAPPVIVVLLLICNNRKIMGSRTNGVASNFLSWLTVLLMGAAATYLIVVTIQGKG
jgi:NRAMP (natural resistance-associated macrophage protein)-like metal ion transporter